MMIKSWISFRRTFRTKISRNKKAFQLNRQPPAFGGGAVTGGVPCGWGGGSLCYLWLASGITGSGHMGTPHPRTDRHDWKRWRAVINVKSNYNCNIGKRVNMSNQSCLVTNVLILLQWQSTITDLFFPIKTAVVGGRWLHYGLLGYGREAARGVCAI